MKIVAVILMAVMGAVMGSFACCQAWRLRERGKKLPARSVCMKCGRKLAWWENLPIVSWAVLRGRCRGCGKKIGAAEILAEVGGAVAFLGLFLGLAGDMADLVWWGWARLACVLAMMVVLMVIAVYDGKWGEMPVSVLFLAVILGGLAMVFLMVGKIWAGAEMLPEVLSAVGGVGILAGVYFALYKVSQGKLVGGGDWVLGLSVALALADWWLCLLVIALANLLAAVYGGVSRRRRIYFGPWLVVAFAVVMSLAEVVCLASLI